MDDGGPAFPAKNYIVPSDLEARHVHALGVTRGMTLRDLYAGMALTGLIAHGWMEADKNADRAWEAADAMLVARKR